MAVGGAGREIKGDTDRFAPEIGGHGRCERIAPPRIADQLLTSSCQTDERLGVARILGERGEEPPLGLRREIRSQFSFKSNGGV